MLINAPCASPENRYNELLVHLTGHHNQHQQPPHHHHGRPIISSTDESINKHPIKQHSNGVFQFNSNDIGLCLQLPFLRR